MKFDALAERVGGSVLRGLGDTVTRRRPVESTVDGETTQDLDSDVVAGIPAMIFARTGNKRELGWGQAPTASELLVVPPGTDIEMDDVIDPEKGRWLGKRFRVKHVDPVSGQCAIELVSAANR
jgi:hypothetical protein